MAAEANLQHGNNDVTIGGIVAPNIDPGNIETPHLGMLFDSWEKAREYYIEYGRCKGFSIRVRSTNKTRYNVDQVTGVHLVCSREGKKRNKDGIVGIDETNGSTSTVQRGCKAQMRILYNKELNKWMITKFADEHSHKFVTPLKRMCLRTNRCMPEAAKDLTEAFNSENLQVSKVPSIFGGATIGFDRKDCWNHLRTKRHKELEIGDAQSVLNYFQRMQKENPQFFYAIQIDENGQALNLFWVDARSRMLYEHFGDMVTFDTTYRTNKYEIPFAPFTGVNHHYQSIQFGCALLRDETETTFSWLFNTWLDAMGGRHPLSFITDQDCAMGAAVKKVFPDTRHRLCLWHIRKKFGEKLSHVYFKKSNFKKEVKKCIYNTYTTQDFEDTWNKLIKDFDLESNEWLNQLYEIRESWVPVYHRGTFYAGMTTTGRSEGVNAFFNEFVRPTTNLREFVVKYDQALKKIIGRENDEDYVSEHKDRLIDENNLILKHAANIYTRNIFEKFRKQLADSIRFKSEEGERDGEFQTYFVTTKTGLFEQFSLKLNTNTFEGYCECKYFEFMGLPCKHLLRVFNKLEVDEIPQHFILKRWMKGANSFRVMDGMITGNNYECSKALRLSHLCRKSMQVWCDALESTTLYKIAVEGLNMIYTQILEERSKMVDCDGQNQVLRSENHMNPRVESANEPCQILIQDPNVSQTKGRPKDNKGKAITSRMKSTVEKASSQRIHKCNICKGQGHDKRNCPQKVEARQSSYHAADDREDRDEDD